MYTYNFSVRIRRLSVHRLYILHKLFPSALGNDNTVQYNTRAALVVIVKKWVANRTKDQLARRSRT
jgi:hypothetical protein